MLPFIRVGAISSPPHQTVPADLPHTAFPSSSPVYYQATSLWAQAMSALQL